MELIQKFNEQEIKIILDSNNKPWFKAKNVAEILGYINTKKAIIDHVNEKNKQILENLIIEENKKKYKYNDLKAIYINKYGLISLLQKCQLSTSQDIINELTQKFDLNLNLVIRRKESEYISNIIDAFSFLNFKTQFSIDNYRIDLYFIDQKIAVECDEFNHKDRNIEYEIERQKFIEKQLECKFIRFNPDEKNFNIFKVIEKITKEIMKR